jgi:DNA invertase Pin-like site-specific DNA recombinase
MKKAYSYIRMSTPDQLKGNSLQRQLEASQAYAQANGMALQEDLRDLGGQARTLPRGYPRGEG